MPTEQSETVVNRSWIASHLSDVPYVEWDRFTVSDWSGEQSVSAYGWIEREDEYKDFLLTIFWPESGEIYFVTSSDEYTEQIQIDWFGEDSLDGHNSCRRIEDTFDIENAVELTEQQKLVTDGGIEESATDQKHPAARNAEQLAWAVWSDDGRNRACYSVVADSEQEAREKARQRHGSPLDNAHIDGPFQNAEPGVYEFEYITEHREIIVVEAPTEEYAKESADANRNYSGEYMETLHTESRRLNSKVNSDD